MCLQCTCESVEIGKIGKISVQLSMVDHPQWSKGSVGLVLSDDPFFVFKPTTVFHYDPAFEYDEDDWSQFHVDKKKNNAFRDAAFKVQKQLKLSPPHSYELISEMKVCFWTQEKHGDYEYWLTHKIALMLHSYEDDNR